MVRSFDLALSIIEARVNSGPAVLIQNWLNKDLTGGVVIHKVAHLYGPQHRAAGAKIRKKVLFTVLKGDF